ncbi:nucleotidyltransferase-like protein [Niallia sp. Krafla_26]|uniref:nucleotidyltransferase-like protein n=1 Tax=Niallia sp. Krafla_26 TaxID=3064703 RepID=UPI003D17BD9C
MEDILRPIYQERASQVNTLSVLLIEKNNQSASLTDTFDAILLIIVKDAQQPVFIKHYTYKGKKAAMHIITESQIHEWLQSGINRKLIEWLVMGKVLFDRNEFMGQLQDRLQVFPTVDRQLKIGLEFSKLIRCYMDGRSFFENQQYLDAYSHIVRSLHHLGRVSIIDKGFHPEMTVWGQVKKIEPEVFKLYNELVNSEEELGKRLELLFLASDFLIHSRIEVGTGYLLDVLKEKDTWTFNEVLSHPSLLLFAADIEVLFEYLIEKRFIEVVNQETKGQGIYHRNYKLSEKLLQKNS